MNLGNLSIDDENRLILHCGRACTVNDAHVSQCDDIRVDANKLLAIRLLSLGKGTRQKRKEQAESDCYFHLSSDQESFRKLSRELNTSD